jgi:hypothetical protein
VSEAARPKKNTSPRKAMKCFFVLPYGLLI